jgi:DNA-binding MarR family transcriptional regulator
MKTDEVAKKILDVIPHSMRQVGIEMRTMMSDELTIPQFRILGAIYRGNSLVSEIAKLHGVSQAAMSKMVQGLVEKGWVEREPQQDDRRQVKLKLSVKGNSFYQQTRKKAQNSIQEKIEGISKQDLFHLEKGLEALEKIFSLK